MTVSSSFGRWLVRLGRAASLVVAIGLAACSSVPPAGQPLPRRGDEIVVAGQYFHTGTRVVLWTDPGGYDAYRVERRFSPLDKSDWDASKEERKDLSTPNRYGIRRQSLSDEELQRVRGGGWDLPLVQRTVDQFVLHFDVCGISRQCFNVLHDHRGLSVHFMLDVDGTIYQTLDVKERAWHATVSNDRSVGIEIANMGAYRPGQKNPFGEWYGTNAAGETVLTIPQRFGPNPVWTPGFAGRPARPEPVEGVVQGTRLLQYDFTPQQYEALTRLTAALCTVLPGIRCDYPKDAEGRLVPHKLPDDELKRYQGVIGHYHIQKNKTDPGPAMQWEKVIRDARKIMEEAR